MDTQSSMFAGQSDLQKKTVLIAVVAIALMVLFPPKTIVNKNPIFDVTQSQPAGYQFLWSDPSAEQKKAARILMGDEVDKYVGSHIEWGKLLIQLGIVGGVALALTRFAARSQAG